MYQGYNVDEKVDLMEKNRKKLILLVLPLIIVAFGIGYVLYSNSSERQARSVVDRHLRSIMTGQENPYDTVDILKVEKIFINVLDFKYLNTIKNERVRDEPMVYDRNDYEKYYKERYNSYEEFLEYI